MESTTLQHKLEEIFSYVNLSDPEKAVLMCAYLSPGCPVDCLKDKVVDGDRIIKKLVDQKILLSRKVGDKTCIYPPPLPILMKNYADQRKTRNLKDLTPTLQGIDQWIKYPLLRSPKVKLKSSKDRDTVLQWFFDLHGVDWERVFCFGDYESFIDTVGLDLETSWIKERTKKARKASVVATRDGKYARQITELSKEELRDCMIDPKDYLDLFILAFPELNTTVMSHKEGEIAFIYSQDIAKKYSQLIKSNFLLR